jgi:hypothetical protein
MLTLFAPFVPPTRRTTSSPLAAVDHAMGHDADFRGGADDSFVLRGEFGHHRFESFGETALRQLAFDFTLGPVMLEARAVEADAFDQAARVTRFVRGIVEAVLERGGTTVDDQDLLRPFTLEVEAVRIIALSITFFNSLTFPGQEY